MRHLAAKSMHERAQSTPSPSPGRPLHLEELGRVLRRSVDVVRGWSTWRRRESDELPAQETYTQLETETEMPFGQQSLKGEDSLSTRRFPLLRYFVGAALLAVTAVAALAVLFVLHSTDRGFSRQSADRSAMDAAHVAHIFYYTVWLPVHMEFPGLSFERTVHPTMMDVFARRSTYGLSIVKLNIWDLDGSLLWSSDPTDPEAGSPLDTGTTRSSTAALH